MKAIFDRYERDIIPKKAPRTQRDNMAELKQLRNTFDSAPIDSLTPAMSADYRDARSAKVRANREIATLSHVFNMAREWGLTAKENPCQGVRKNREKPRDFYANETVLAAVYKQAIPELKDAMDLAYLTGQRPADVLAMRKDDIRDGYLVVEQNKTHKKLRIMLMLEGEENSLGRLIRMMNLRNQAHSSPYLIVSGCGQRISASMLRLRWDKPGIRLRLLLGKEVTNCLRRESGSFSFVISDRRRHQKYKALRTPACCLGTRKGTLPSECIGVWAPSRNPPNRRSFGTVPEKYRNCCRFRALQEQNCSTPKTQKPLISQGFKYGGGVEIRTLG